jgi:hypothetical protein
MGVWRRRGEAASAAAPYSAHHGLYSEAVVSSVTSAVALAEVGRFREAVEYVQKAAKALYEAARDVFERVEITVQRLVELFVEAVARVLAWVDEHKAYLFLMTAVAAGVVALSAALNLWGLVELEKLAHAAMGVPPFIPASVREYPREDAFNILRGASDPYEKFKKIASEANAGRVKLTEPWESLRVLIMPKPSEEKRLMHGGGAELYSKYREDENYKRALFYAVLALEEVFGVYRSALRKYVEERGKAVEKREVGEGPFKKVVYVADLGQLKQLAEEEGKAFEEAVSTLRERLNECAVKYGLRDLLDMNEYMARGLAEAKQPELSKFNDVSFGVKAYAALIAYREHALGRRSAYGTAAWYWLEVGGSARLLYYAPITAYIKAKKARAGRSAAVEELVADALRRLFLKPGANHYRGFVEELTKGGRLALMFEKETDSSYVFRLYRLEEGGKFVELEGVKLRIEKVGEGEMASIVYALKFDDVERWQGFFKQEREAGMKAAEEVKGRLPVEDRLPYMLGWVASDVAIRRKGNKRMLEMSTSHLWQLAETHALFDWPYVAVHGVNLTLEGPKPLFDTKTSLENLDNAIRISADGGWLRMLSDREGLEDLMYVKSWDDLKRWVVENWGLVVDAAVSRLREVLKEEELEKLLAPEGGDAAEGRKGRQVAPRDKQKDGKNVWEEVRNELEALRDKLNDDKIAREAIAPALLLIQAEKLGVNEATLRYFAAVTSGAIGGDGHVSAAMKKVELASGKHAVALLWAAALAAHGIKAEVRRIWSASQVVTSGGGAARLASLYFLYGPPLLEGDERIINHKLAEAVELAAMGLDIRWEGLRRTGKGRVAADLTISVGGVAVKYNVYLSNEVKLQFNSTDQGRVELATRLLRLAGVDAEVKKAEVGSKDIWYVEVSTDRLTAGRKELREALVKIVKKAVENGWVEAGKAERWLVKLEKGLTLREGWPKYHVGLARSSALDVRYQSTNPDNIEREAQRLRDMGLEEGRHFSVKMPGGGREGYVSILKEGLAHAAWLSVHGSGEQQKPAARFVEYILQRAKEAGEEVYEKAKEIIEEGKARGSLTLKGFEKRVEVGSKEYLVKVIGGEAVEEDRDGKKLLRIKITAEVGGVRHDYTITYGRRGRNNAAVGRAYAKADAPGGREADAERYSALIKALTGKEPRVIERSDGRIDIICGREHLDGFMRYAELADAIEKWLEETRR